MWAASLRYLFTFPILWLMLAGKSQTGKVWSAVKEAPVPWLVWSTVGFGLFYAPLTFGSVLGESWLAAATWQLTIVAGVLLTPLFGKRIPVRNLGWSFLVLAGVFMMQVPHLKRLEVRTCLLYTSRQGKLRAGRTGGDVRTQAVRLRRLVFSGKGLPGQKRILRVLRPVFK